MRDKLRKFLKVINWDSQVIYTVATESQEDGFKRFLIHYKSKDDDLIPAYLLIPDTDGPHRAVLIHHQHNGERHLGKSEIAGLAGSPQQAFGPALAKKGFAILIPDSICFEDRRRNKVGIEPDEGEQDWLQHYNEMSYRLIKGDTLMRKVLEDASVGLSLLHQLPSVDRDRIGVIGHSYGGNTALFQTAIDERIQFVCSSGAVCSYQNKVLNGTGLEMALVIPKFVENFEILDVLRAIAPRELLVVSAEEDKYSKDADSIVRAAQSTFGSAKTLTHMRYPGSHALTDERFRDIISWISAR